MDQTDFLFKLISAAVGLGALITGAIMRDRALTKKISDGDANSHKRIDTLKDELNSNFARKDDMKDSVSRVERSVENLGKELRGQHNQILELLMKDR